MGVEEHKSKSMAFGQFEQALARFSINAERSCHSSFDRIGANEDWQ
jgi:hypothetical protein